MGRENVLTPDLCTVCWEFYYLNGLTEMNCNVTVIPIYSVNEKDCMELPVNNMKPDEYTTDILLGFDDGTWAIHDHPLTGTWRLETNESYGDRSFWYKIEPNTENRRLLQTQSREWYMFYDPTWRFWVIDTKLGPLTNNNSYLYCMHWDEFEPFNCKTWYTQNNTVTMFTDYTFLPTSAPTPIHTISAPSIKPSYSYLDDEDDGDDGLETNKSSTWAIWQIAGIITLFVCLMCGITFYCRKMRKTKHRFKKDVDHTVISMHSNSDEAVDLNLIQMGNGPTRTSKGEVVLDDSEDSISNGIDGLDEVTTGVNDADDNVEKPFNEQQDDSDDDAEDMYIRGGKKKKGYQQMNESDDNQIPFDE